METAVPKDLKKSINSTTNKTMKPKLRGRNKTAAPLKVVYISNPMKVKTSASQFRALVQQLTGQDAVEWPEAAAAFQKIDAMNIDHHDHQTLPYGGILKNNDHVLLDDYYQYYKDNGNYHMRPAAGGGVLDVNQMQGIRSDNMYFGPSDYYGHDEQQQIMLEGFDSFESLIACDNPASDQGFGAVDDAV